MIKDLPPSRTADQFVVRFPDGMRDRIAEAAKTAGRSMNAEIVTRLQKSFERPVIEWKGSPIPGRSEEDQRLLQIASRGCNMMATVISQMAADVKDPGQLELLRQCEDLARSLAEATKQRETA